jgi:thiamine-monophosphate kinase
LLKELDVKPTAMIDVSDGLASEILHICKQSNKGCNLYEEKIPIDPMTYETAREFGLDPTVCALSGGEDYELLFTVKTS